MAAPSHLKSLQALDMAIREGSLKAAAARLGITPAAVGQRIRALEDFLGTDLMVRVRSGLHPTVELDRALADLQLAFSALERVTDTLDFQRVTEIHIVADPDWSELWLLPRIKSFRSEHPNILFCINGAGDVPVRLGAPDIRVECHRDAIGEALYTDLLVPVCSPRNIHRVAGYDQVDELEGLPLLHVERRAEADDFPGWPEWVAEFGQRKSGVDRGVKYRHLRLALDAAREAVGFVLAGKSLIDRDLRTEDLVLVFTEGHQLQAPYPYRLRAREAAESRPQIARFIEWLRMETEKTRLSLES